MKRMFRLFTATACLAIVALPALAQEEPYPPGETQLEIAKHVEGDEVGVSFDFLVECEQAGIDAFSLGDGEIATLSVPIGDVCSVSEVGVDPLDVAFVVTPADAEVERGEDPPSVTLAVADASAVLVDVFNGFDEVLGPATLELEKDLAATSARSRSAFAGTGYEFRVRCASVDEVVRLRPGESARWLGIPVGRRCVITETDTQDAASTRITVRIDGEVVRRLSGERLTVDFPTEPDVLVQVLFTNTPKAIDPVDETDVLARSGFDLTWGMLLALGLILPGSGAVLVARRRVRKRVVDE